MIDMPTKRIPARINPAKGDARFDRGYNRCHDEYTAYHNQEIERLKAERLVELDEWELLFILETNIPQDYSTAMKADARRLGIHKSIEAICSTFGTKQIQEASLDKQELDEEAVFMILQENKDELCNSQCGTITIARTICNRFRRTQIQVEDVETALIAAMSEFWNMNEETKKVVKEIVLEIVDFVNGKEK